MPYTRNKYKTCTNVFIKINLNFNRSIAILESLSLFPIYKLIGRSRIDGARIISAATTREIRQISRRVIACRFSTDIQSRSLTRLTRCARVRMFPRCKSYSDVPPFAFPMSRLSNDETGAREMVHRPKDLSRAFHGRTEFQMGGKYLPSKRRLKVAKQRLSRH